MRAFTRIRYFSSQPFLTPVADSLINLPSFLEFYRPVIEIAENSIQSIVSFTGLPWWLSISLLTITVRSANLPLLFLQYRSMAPLATAMPSYRLLGEILKESKASSMKKFSACLSSSRQINKAHNTKFSKAFIYVILQVPQFITFVWGVRSLCVKNAELKTGGALWFSDLTAPDPYMVLPVLSLGITYMNLQRGITSTNKDWLINRFKSVVQMWLIVTLPLSVQWPSGVFCYWVTNAIYSYFQTSALTNPRIMQLINPDLQKNLIKIYSKSIPEDESARLANLLNTGIEGYSKVSENELEKVVTTYLEHQDSLSTK